MTTKLYAGILVVTLNLMWLPTSVSAADSETGAPSFLFSADNNVAQTQKEFRSAIAPSTAVRDDRWLNAPLTRLDYVLIRIQAQLTTNLTTTAQQDVDEYFLRDQRSMRIPNSIDFSASFSNEKGRLIIGAGVLAHGRPIKPMKQLCESMLTIMERWYPLEPFGYSWHNGALGPLIRDDPNAYSDVVRKLAASTLFTAAVSTDYSNNGLANFFSLGCARQKANAPIIFWKYSAKMRP